jgi:hypothetical protein
MTASAYFSDFKRDIVGLRSVAIGNL